MGETNLSTAQRLARLASPATLALATAGLWASGATAQSVETIDATVQIQDDITLIKTRDMDFGRIIVPRSGRVDMSAEETPTCTPNNTLELLDTCQSASFLGTAGQGFNIRVRVPPRRRINLTGPGRDLRLRRMSVGAGDGLTFLRRVNRNFDFAVTDPGGQFEFHIGGRLLFRNNQAPGVYSGTFDVEVEYE